MSGAELLSTSWTRGARSRSSSPRGGRGSRRSRRACRTFGSARGASRACAAKRSRSLAGVSVDYYTRLERGNASGVSETVLEALARALQLDEAERAHLFDLARAHADHGRATRRRAQRSSAMRPGVQRMLDAMTGAPAFVRNGRHGHPRRQPSRPRALLASTSTARASPPNTARFVFLDPRAPDFYVDWEQRRERRRRHPALRGRPQPVRPRPLRPRRRAVDTERALPHALGRARRPLPRHGRRSASTTRSSASST